MKKFSQTIFLACGLLLTLAAFPVFAQKTVESEINRNPLQDFSERVLQSVLEKKVDLTKPFSVELEGVLDGDGKLDPQKSKFIKSEGDAEMIAIGKDLIETVNASGLFAYLRNMGAENVKLALAQNESECYFNIVSEQKTPERAKTTASAFDALVIMALMLDKQSAKKLDDNSRALLNGIKVNYKGSEITLNFTFQKTFIQELINSGLQKYGNKTVK